MNSYMLSPIEPQFDASTSVFNLSGNTCIPFDPANTDYQQFKIQVANGVELQDPDGNVMTQAEADAFLETVP